MQPENLKLFRERLEERGLLPYAAEALYASGKLAGACYKLELEAAFRSAELSGFQLLDIKDFTGQGTALVGILNAFHKNKGIIPRSEWRMFCSDAVLLPTLDSFVMKGGSCVACEIKLRYYRPEKLLKPQLKAVWYLKRQAGSTEENRIEKQVQTMACQETAGRGLFTLGTLALNVPACRNNALYALRFVLTSENAAAVENEYDIFLYEEKTLRSGVILNEEISLNEALNKEDLNKEDLNKEVLNKKVLKQKIFVQNERAVCITNDNAQGLKACKNGESVLLFVNPDSTLPDSTIKGEYCTDFWCYPMFRSISEGAGKPVPTGTMGLLIDNKHPALSEFVSETYTTAQWYQIIMHSRPMILDKMRETRNLKPIVRMLDNFERNHNLGLLYEVKYGAGKMLVCHADLMTLKEDYPEADCLYRSLVTYVCSKKFCETRITVEEA